MRAAGEVALTCEVRFEQLMQLSGLLRVQRVPIVDLCQRSNGLTHDCLYSVAAVAQLLRKHRPHAAGVDEHKPGRGFR